MPNEYIAQTQDLCKRCPYRLICPHRCRSSCCSCCPCPLAAFTALIRDQQTGAPLAGAVFGLSRDNQRPLHATSDYRGELHFDRLGPGAYTLREIQPPAGYRLSEETHTVEVRPDGTVTLDGGPADGYVLWNTRLIGLTFYKIEAVLGTPIAGASFQLSGGQAAASDGNGLVDFGVLPQGVYTLRETAAPAGYLPDPTVYTVMVTAAGGIEIDGLAPERFCVKNRPYPLFSFAKFDTASGWPLAGAVFHLSNGMSVTSNDCGLVEFGPLAPGRYTMREEPPAGYLPNPHEYAVEVTVSGIITVDGVELEAFRAGNTPLPGLLFRKYDAATGQPLEGAAFSLSNGVTALSDGGGLVNLGLLTPGIYTLEESAPPAGYLPVERGFIVEVSASGEITVDDIPLEAFSVENVPYTRFRFRKRDSVSGRLLPGAVFQLSNGAQAQSDGSGLVNFGPLAPGSYTMTEIQAPDGYLTGAHTYTVEVDSTGEITVDGVELALFSAGDDPLPELSFIKTDETGGIPLAGAAFHLTPSGQTVLSDMDGRVSFGTLAEGRYQLREIVAPPGYDLSGEVYDVTVASDGRITVNGSPLSAFRVLNQRSEQPTPQPTSQP